METISQIEGTSEQVQFQGFEIIKQSPAHQYIPIRQPSSGHTGPESSAQLTNKITKLGLKANFFQSLSTANEPNPVSDRQIHNEIAELHLEPTFDNANNQFDSSAIPITAEKDLQQQLDDLQIGTRAIESSDNLNPISSNLKNPPIQLTVLPCAPENSSDGYIMTTEGT